MADSFYFPSLLALLVVPLLVRWRWGLVPALIVTVTEIILVALVFYLMASYHMLPDMNVGETASESEHPFAKIRRGQAAGYAQLFIFGMGPALAALVGGGLAVVWSAVLAAWRTIATRTQLPR